MNLPPPVTRYLLIAMAVVFALQQIPGDFLLINFALWPWGEFNAGTGADGLPVWVGFKPWQIVSYGLLHGSFMHLLFNGIGLYQFGGQVESTVGPRRFATFFLVCVAGAGLSQLLVTSIMVGSGQPPFPTIGASGGVLGVLVAYAVMFPRNKMIIFPVPIPMSARTVVLLFGAASLLMGFTGTMQGIAHFAHLGGLLAGWLMLRYWRGQPPFGRKPPPRPRLVR